MMESLLQVHSRSAPEEVEGNGVHGFDVGRAGPDGHSTSLNWLKGGVSEFPYWVPPPPDKEYNPTRSHRSQEKLRHDGKERGGLRRVFPQNQVHQGELQI